MAYYYQCESCRTQVTTESKRTIRCSSCGQSMEVVAEEKWLFKCSNCDFTITGNLGSGKSVRPCPACDNGMMYPSKPY